MKYITVESDSRWTQKRIFYIPDGSFVVEEGLFFVYVLTVKTAVHLASAANIWRGQCQFFPQSLEELLQS